MSGPPEEEKPPGKLPLCPDDPTHPLGAGEPSRSPAGPGLSAPPLAALRARYEILAELGRGGMGIVYKARDRETDAIVALKVLKPEMAADKAAIERFKSELRLAVAGWLR